LAVISVLGVIAIVLIPNFSKILKDSKEELYNKQIEVIKTATKMWTTDEENKIFLISNSVWPYTITLGDLQDSLFIDKNIINPITDKIFSDSTLIYIDYVNNQYIFNVDEESLENEIITLNGEKNISIDVNSNYIEPGYSAIDSNNNDISENVEVSFYKDGLPIDEINTDTLSNYTIKYLVSYFDNDGNFKQAMNFRRLRVVDRISPELFCMDCEENMIYVESSNSYVLPEITVTDNYDLDIDVVKIGSFSSIIPGEKVIKYIATDSSGNVASLDIKFVVKDTINPIIVSIDRKEDDNNYITYTVTASDNGSGIKDYSIDGGMTWQKSNVFVVEDEPTIRKFIVRDNVLNISLRQLSEEYTTEFTYTGDIQMYVVPKTGKYKIELWGASGGIEDSITVTAETSTGTYTEREANFKGGYGGYTSGYIDLNKNQILYVYVGEVGKRILSNTFNGGGVGGPGGTGYKGTNLNGDEKASGYSGGGATDIRLVDGLWNDFDSLKSRIMVAAGGGGSTVDTYSQAGELGAGGGLIGSTGGYYPGHPFVDQNGKGGTQTSGGVAATIHFNATGITEAGKFGIGGGTTSISSQTGAGGGGGGYYGGSGASGTIAGGSGQGGGGGSSFISGHNGCNAISETSTMNNIIHTNQSIHYTGYTFTDTIMIDGNGYSWTNQKNDYVGIPSYDGLSILDKNIGNGYAKITYIEN